MVHHILKLKPRYRWIYIVALSPYHLKNFAKPEVNFIAGVDIRFVIYFDIRMCMKYHILATCKKCNVHIRRIIRGYIMKPACYFLITALVVSTIDYCNARSTVISDNTHLQNLHSSAAPRVVLTATSSHVTPVLVDLHWLSVRQCIRLKIIVHSVMCYI